MGPLLPRGLCSKLHTRNLIAPLLVSLVLVIEPFRLCNHRPTMASQPPPPSKKLPPLSILAAVGGSKKESTPTQSKSNESGPTTDSNAGIPPAAAKPPSFHQDNNNNKNNNPPAPSGGYESMNSNSSGSGGSLPKKRVKPPCSVPTCTNRAVQGGKCIVSIFNWCIILRLLCLNYWDMFGL